MLSLYYPLIVIFFIHPIKEKWRDSGYNLQDITIDLHFLTFAFPPFYNAIQIRVT